jgi:ribose transport system ATP-binding protein
VTEDRQLHGLVLGMSVRENATLASLPRLTHFGFLSFAREREVADEYVRQLDIRTPSIDQEVVNLSGGNQQKVVLAKWLATHPRVLILDEPTRGIDVGAKAEVHALMSRLAEAGVAILMISSELPEILGMSDRILVIRQGQVSSEFSRAEATQEKILASAA